MSDRKIVEYFQTSRELATLCQQNGWPDTETLEVRIGPEDGRGRVCSVSFEEILMEGSGCVAGRLARWGQFVVKLDADGNVRAAEII
ncbi:MAG: hypothetical protein ACYCQK_02885 [Acidiferrobacteraceae bacterium]